MTSHGGWGRAIGCWLMGCIPVVLAGILAATIVSSILVGWHFMIVGFAALLTLYTQPGPMLARAVVRRSLPLAWYLVLLALSLGPGALIFAISFFGNDEKGLGRITGVANLACGFTGYIVAVARGRLHPISWPRWRNIRRGFDVILPTGSNRGDGNESRPI